MRPLLINPLSTLTLPEVPDPGAGDSLNPFGGLVLLVDPRSLLQGLPEVTELLAPPDGMMMGRRRGTPCTQQNHQGNGRELRPEESTST